MSEPEERNWGSEPWRAPTLQEGDTVLFEECGRIIKAHTYGHDNNGIDYRSHYFRIVDRHHRCYLLVKHGGGEEAVQLDYNAARCAQFFVPLDSNQRYLLMHLLYNVHSKARREAEEGMRREWAAAFLDKRIKKKRRDGMVYVRIEPKAGATLEATR